MPIYEPFEERVMSAVNEAPPQLVEVMLETLVATHGENSAQTVALVRSIRALTRLAGAMSHELAAAANESTDLQVLLTILQDPSAQAYLSEQDPLAEAKIRGLHSQSIILAAEGGCISSHDAATFIGVSPQAVDKARKVGSYIAFPRGQNRFSYPRWQFENGHTLPGLRKVLRALGDASPWIKANFFLSPTSRLDEKRPLDFLRMRKIDEVVAAAKSFGEHGAA